MNYENILVDQEGAIAILTIAREKQLNALNKVTISELNNALTVLESDQDVRVIIITGAGSKAFVAGADIKEFAHFNQEQGAALSEKGQELLFDKIANYTKPIIAAINGFALGGGLELAMSCHIRIASENAKMGLPELSLGLIPGYGGTQRLTQLIGKGLALELMLSSRMLTADEALSCQLINSVSTLDELLGNAKKIAQSIVKNSPVAVKKLLEAVRLGTDIQAGLKQEVRLFGECFGTEDFKEGTTAFIEKRKPNFN